MAKLGKSVHIAGEARAQLAADLKAQYEQGASIRELTRTTGRSYGFIHQVLSETQVPLHGRGRPCHRRTTPPVRLSAPWRWPAAQHPHATPGGIKGWMRRCAQER